MPAHVPIKKPTETEALDAMYYLPLNGKDRNCRRTTINNYVKQDGPLQMFDSRGELLFYASVQQTINKVPNKLLVIEALKDLYEDSDPRAFDTLSAAIEKISITSWPGFFTRLNKEMMDELLSYMDANDKTEEGGMITVYGDAKFDIRAKPPTPGAHHTVLPGTKPLTNEAA